MRGWSELDRVLASPLSSHIADNQHFQHGSFRHRLRTTDWRGGACSLLAVQVSE